MSQNIAKGSFDKIFEDAGIYLLKAQSDKVGSQEFTYEVDKSFLQLHFCAKGSAEFLFNQGSYQLQLSDESSLLLYNTQRNLPIHLVLRPSSEVLSVIIAIQKFHAFFSEDAEYISFLSSSSQDKKYYAQEVMTPAMAVVLSQILNFNLHPSIRPLFTKGKIYELIALYFNKSADADIAQCPFLADEENVRKIRRAKEIILERMLEPPTLQELSEEIELPLKKLKEGFKQIYGDSVYGYLLNHKMDLARKMLETGKYNVNEVGLKIGYSTASHFIASFKKKYGTTPKKYLGSLV